MGNSKDLARRVLLTGMIREEERFVELLQGVFNASAHDNSRQLQVRFSIRARTVSRESDRSHNAYPGVHHGRPMAGFARTAVVG